MLRFKWTSKDILTNKDAYDMVHLCQTHLAANMILAGGFDSETTGLHIIHDYPFLFQFGWITTDMKGYTFAVDLELQPILSRQIIAAWHKLAEQLKVYLAHHVTFDLHMLQNFGQPYTASNISDTLFYIRYAHDAITPKYGGPPLKLKEYAARYIDGNAKTHEKLLDHEKTAIAKELNLKLAARLKICGKPPEQYNAKSYTAKVLDEMFADPVFTAEDLPEPARTAYLTWLQDDVPCWLKDKVTARVESSQIPYNKLNRANIKIYAHYDIIWVLEIWYSLAPVVQARGNERGIEIENKLIYPLQEMERVGFATRKDYLEQCRQDMKKYILERRQVLYQLAGCIIKPSQNTLIKELLASRFQRCVTTTRDEELRQLQTAIKQHTVPAISEEIDTACIAFIDTLAELRTLEKWYSAYVIRFLKELKHTNRLYTTIHQVGTVSGRVTSDFQQFPKDAIKTVAGVELFQPRKMIESSGGDYRGILYLDYSQIELRFQALYTILVGNPDTNLCRAYMPFNCVNDAGDLFDCNNPEHIKHWKDAWYYAESPDKLWTPTDVHGATTKAAFGITESDPDYKHLRYVGKRVNFAKNYGAQYKKICTMFPDYSAEQCRRIDSAYYTAFPGVKKYHDYCYSRADYAYTENLFGIRYYGVSGHKLINMLIQGSAAFYLKLKIIELYEYRKRNNLKTKWQMQIHDELSWEIHKDDDPKHCFAFKRIMEDWPDAIVPIVAEMEFTSTTWAEKKEVETLDDLQLYLSTRSVG